LPLQSAKNKRWSLGSPWLSVCAHRHYLAAWISCSQQVMNLVNVLIASLFLSFLHVQALTLFFLSWCFSV
jgi:hypothetical protein